MKRFLLPVLLVLSATILPAQTLEERIRLNHLEPSQLVERLQLVLGNDLQVVPDDKAKTLILRLPTVEGNELDVERQRLIARQIIAALDEPVPDIEITIYALQPAMLSDGELKNLESRLLEKPLEFPKGISPKGVIFWTKREAVDKDALSIEQTQGKMPGQEITGNVKARGRVMPAVRNDDQVACVLDMELIRQKPDGQSSAVVPLKTTIGNASDTPVMIGSVPGDKPEDRVQFYIWARPKAEDKKPATLR
jgi:hypothetical protein